MFPAEGTGTGRGGLGRGQGCGWGMCLGMVGTVHGGHGVGDPGTGTRGGVGTWGHEDGREWDGGTRGQAHVGTGGTRRLAYRWDTGMNGTRGQACMGTWGPVGHGDLGMDGMLGESQLGTRGPV